jgi:hypothetical protein
MARAGGGSGVITEHVHLRRAAVSHERGCRAGKESADQRVDHGGDGEHGEDDEEIALQTRLLLPLDLLLLGRVLLLRTRTRTPAVSVCAPELAARAGAGGRAAVLTSITSPLMKW